MSFNLQPREYFTIVRHLPDPADTNTSYVKAIIKNSRTGVTLDTLTLVESGANTHRFTKDYQVPADVSGLGFYIDITTEVYTDSGMTTKSAVYGEDNNTYLVFDRTKRIGGGGGLDVDYKRINKIVTEAMKAIEKAEAPEVNLAPVMDELRAIKETCMGIEMPEQEKVELSPVLMAIKDTQTAILKSIDSKEVTESTDLSPVLDAISRVEGTINDATSTQGAKLDKTLSMFENLLAKFTKTFNEDYPQLSEALDALIKKMREAFLYVNSTPTNKVNPEDRVKKLTGQ